jgi:hypothetical protein
VLWLKTEAELPAGTFDRIDEQVRPAYYWRELYRVGEFRVGSGAGGCRVRQLTI